MKLSGLYGEAKNAPLYFCVPVSQTLSKENGTVLFCCTRRPSDGTNNGTLIYILIITVNFKMLYRKLDGNTIRHFRIQKKSPLFKKNYLPSWESWSVTFIHVFSLPDFNGTFFVKRLRRKLKVSNFCSNWTTFRQLKTKTIGKKNELWCYGLTGRYLRRSINCTN